MSEIRAGIVGVGYVGSGDIEAVKRLGYAEVSAIVMRDAVKAEEVCRKLGIQKYYTE